MKQLNQDEAKRTSERVLGFSRADECSVRIDGSRVGNIRFARNSVSTAGLNDDARLSVTVAFGKRQGTAVVNEFDDKPLEKAVRRAGDTARLAPENPDPVAMLNNVEELGRPVVVGPEEVRFQMVIPPMKLRDFNFTSLSDAV